MAGKRQRGIRRTVSVSTMGSGSNIFESSPLPEYPKEKQKAPLLASHSPHRMLASSNTVKPPPIDAHAVSPPQPAAPLQPLPVSQKSEKPPSTLPSSGRGRSERKCVGLGVVAALADESGASTGVKDGKDEAPPSVVSQNAIVPPCAQHLSHNTDMQGRSAIFLHESACSDDYDDLVSMELPAVNFLEACYLCKRHLSQGRDIYMYRGDQAFCSEECRYEQIVLDERREKCSLQAIKMRTSTSPIQSRDQQSQRVTSGAAAAG